MPTATGNQARGAAREQETGGIRIPLLRVERARVREVESSGVDAPALEAELRRVVQGEVRFDSGSRALYSTDGSNYRQVPIGVVVPFHEDDVIATVAACRRFGAPVLSRGGGTSLAGQSCNVAGVNDFSKNINKILEIDPGRKRARVQPGVVLDWLRDAAEKHQLTFGPDPSTHNHCTLGGMIGNNSCGVHSVMAGKTDDNVHELDILLYDGTRMTVGPTTEHELERFIREGGRRGEIYGRLKALRDQYAGEIRSRFPDIPRRVSGFNLPQLLPEHGFDVARALVGSESTCVIVLQAVVRLVDSPPARSLLVLGYPDVYTAGDHIPDVLAAGPIACEGLDDNLVDDMKKKKLHPQDLTLLPAGGGWLIVEFGGETKEESDGRARRLMDALEGSSDAPHMKLFDNPAEEEILWTVRRSGLGATARVPGEKDTWEGWEDSSVPPDKVGVYLRQLRELFRKYDYKCALYGHFGQGCIHTRIDFDLVTKAGIAKYRSFIHEAADLVLSFGGSLSGEHGDGQSRGELLPKMFGPTLMEAFREFKSIWDPDGKMNPGKVIDPYKADDNLRLGVQYNPPEVPTHFAFLEDDGSFARVSTRCVGVGECRRQHGGTMCPSYRATMEEEHSTRGRAHLLFEMLEGWPLADGWRSNAVRDALDLCLACKGCKHDCPMNVDMATYKAEFLSHYYKGRLRPVHAYSMGLIYWWARLASNAPSLVNLVTHAPVLGGLFKRLGGIAPERDVPTFARQTLREWFETRRQQSDAAAAAGGPSRTGAARVMLWPDTFNNHFFPETGKAAVEVLEAAGFDVEMPPRSLCCGRPLYDFGMLDLARRQLRQILDTLKPWVEDGVPIIGLEPSCVAVFRDEMVNLFPHDQDAQRLSQQTFLLSEFFQKKAPDVALPTLEGHAVVHGHCHHKSLMGMDDERAVLKRMGLDCRILDNGCCGMAGSFGFEREHYDVSIKVGEHELLPAVRDTPKDAFIVANGFSCREQIAQTTDRRALHLAEVMRLALDPPMRSGVQVGSLGDYPERKLLTSRGPSAGPVAAAAVAGLVLVAGAAWLASRRRR